MLKRLLLLFSSTILLLNVSFSQCFQVTDGMGAFSNTPLFVSCTPGGFTVFIQTDQTIGPYTIDWGDGTANSTGASLIPPALEQHTYAATTDTFNLVITNTGDGCVVNGVVVLERNPLASIQLPAGDDNFGCTPIQFRFINSSTQVSQTTFFTWDFGDGSPTETYNYTNQNTIVTHTYLPGLGVMSCDLEVQLTATNNCGTSTASFFPLKVWDLDEAVITPSATLLCFPEATVNYTNSTIRNCYAEGNQTQRYEYWNFGNYWGTGSDSIIDWRPWNPPIIAPPPITYPGIGTYNVMLIDSSFCGKDTTFQTIEITAPPTALLGSNKDTICEGESVTFINNTVGAANQFFWDYDLGSGFQQSSGSNKTRTYNVTGDYTIQLIVGINGAAGCRDTTSIDLYVNPSPTAGFNFTPDNKCDSATVVFTNTSTGNIVQWDWTFGNGNTFAGENPPPEFYPTAGTYSVLLVVENNQGCIDSIRQSIRVREVPVADFSVSSVCLNQLAQFNDLTTATIDPITSYKWYFGDGDSSSAQNPTHLYIAFGTFQVVQIVDNGFCQDSDTLVVVVENNPLAAFTPDQDSGCSRLTVNFTNTSTANAINFIWDFGDGSSTVMARDTFHTYTNAGLNDTTFVVEMIARTTFGCADTIYDTITVFPSPIPSFTSNAILDCGPVTVDFVNTTLGNNLNFFWDFDDGTALSTDTNPTHIFDNKTLFITNYNVRLIVESANGCRDTSIQVVPIYPEPVFTFQVVPDSGCSPLVVSFPSVVGAVDYQWDFGDGATGTGPTPSHTYINNSTNDLLLNVRLISQNSFGCLDTNFGTVLIYPSPVSIFTLDTNIGCQPLPIQITNNSTGANNFEWSFGDATTSTNNNAVFTKTYTNTSALTNFNTIQLITTTTNGCADTSSNVIQVHPFINAAYASDSIGCSPFDVRFINQSIGAAQFKWKFGNGDSSIAINPNKLYINATNSNQTYRSVLTVTSPQGCIDTADRNILVYAKPVANFSLSDSTGCHPIQATITNNSINADFCDWTYGDGVTLASCFATNVHSYNNTTSFFPITYNTILEVTTVNGCKDTLSKPVVVNPEVIAAFSAPIEGCSPLPVSLQNQSVGGQNFTWSFGDGDSSFTTSPSHLFVNDSLRDTTYQIKLITESQYNCSDSITKNIEIFAKPIANFSLDTNRGCHPLQVLISNNSSIADSCRWVYGDGNITDSCFISRLKIYNNTQSNLPQIYNTRLFVFTDNGCRDTSNINVTVNPDLQANFTSITQGCSPLSVGFTNQSIGTQSYNWTYGDGGSSIGINPSHLFINPGINDTTYTTQLNVMNSYGCTDSISQIITVFPKPTADYSVSVNGGCQPLPVNFTNQSIISDNCYWSFGDGMVDTTCAGTVHTYSNAFSLVPVNYQSRLIVETSNGCKDTLSRNISVNPEVIASITGDTVGCSPLATTYRSQSFGAINYLWDFGDGGQASGLIAANTYTNIGAVDVNFQVRLIASSIYGCNDTAYQNVRVLPTPLPNFSATPGFQVFPNSTVTLANSTNPGNWSFNWDFGDLTSSTFRNPASHTYNTWGIYNIKLVASSASCSDSIIKPITIDVPIPIVEFSDSASGCAPLEVSFQNTSLYGAQYEWDFGDGRGVSTSENPVYTYLNAGEYNVTLRVKGFAPNKEAVLVKQNYIKVFKSPRAGFFINKETVFIPNDPLVLFNSSIDADIYTWDFGDGNSSNEFSPTHFYQDEGEFQIQLISESLNGCADTFLLPNLVLAELEGSIKIPNAFTPDPNGPSGGGINPFAGLDGLNDVFYAKVAGTTEYELNIFNKWGELLFVSNNVRIGWDGYYKGELCQQDAYAWKIVAKFADGTTVVKAGDLLLLR